MDTEILTNVLALSSVKPIDTHWLIDNLQNCNTIVILEEGNKIEAVGSRSLIYFN